MVTEIIFAQFIEQKLEGLESCQFQFDNLQMDSEYIIKLYSILGQNEGKQPAVVRLRTEGKKLKFQIKSILV